MLCKISLQSQGYVNLSDVRLTAVALNQQIPQIKDLPHQCRASTTLFARILCRSLMVLLYRDNPLLRLTAIYPLLCQERSSGEEKEKFCICYSKGSLCSFELSYSYNRGDMTHTKHQSQQILKIFIFPSTLYSSSQKLLLGECHCNSPYITIYSPFLLHYPKWNRHAITKPAHAILYSLQFPTSHLKNKYFTVI